MFEEIVRIPIEETLKDMNLVIDEWTKPKRQEPGDIDKREAEKLKKRLAKLSKKGRFEVNIDAQMKWRLCAARMMRQQFDKPWCYNGWEYRSDWALNFYKHGKEWRKPWPGGDCNLRVLMEQGIVQMVMVIHLGEVVLVLRDKMRQILNQPVRVALV